MVSIYGGSSNSQAEKVVITRLYQHTTQDRFTKPLCTRMSFDITYIKNPAIGTFHKFSHIKQIITGTVSFQITILCKGKNRIKHFRTWENHHMKITVQLPLAATTSTIVSFPPPQVMATARGALVAFQVLSWNVFFWEDVGGKPNWKFVWIYFAYICIYIYMV